MRFHFIFLLAAALAITQQCGAQDNTEASAADGVLPAPVGASPVPAVGASPSSPSSTSKPTSSAGSPPNVAITPDREVSWRLLVPNMLQDQRQIWMFPISVARGHHLKPTIAFLAITTALAVEDERMMTPVRTTTAFNGFNKVFSGFNTATALEVFPAVFYGIALFRKDTYGQHTVLLAGEAVIDSEIVTTVLKDIDRRYRPGSVPPGGDLSATWFKQTQGSYIGGVGSFPSGHTIAAFSVATVFADRYPHPIWHVWVVYGLAGLVGFSRVPLQAHFPSDVFAGAFLGYAIAHYVVRHPKEIDLERDMLSSDPDSRVETAGARSSQ